MAAAVPEAPLRVLVTVGSTSFPALLQATLSDDILRQLGSSSRALKPHAASVQPTLILQHGATPLPTILESFLAEPVDPASRLVPEAGLRKVGSKWGYTGAVRTELDPGEEGLLKVKLASDSSMHAPAPLDHGSGQKAEPAEMTLQKTVQEVKSSVRRRIRARRSGADVELDAAVASALQEPNSQQEGVRANHDISEENEDVTDSSSDSDGDLEDWNLEARPSDPSWTGGSTGRQHGASPLAGHSEPQRLQLETVQGVHLTLVDYLPDITAEMKQSDIIICHAGAGTILESLRVSRPAGAPKVLVVPNTSLMDNHQGELADELARSGYCKSGSVDTLSQDLAALLDHFATPSKPFPSVEPAHFAQIVDDLVGFS